MDAIKWGEPWKDRGIEEQNEKKNTGSSKKGEGEKDRLTFSDWDPWDNERLGKPGSGTKRQ